MNWKRFRKEPHGFLPGLRAEVRSLERDYAAGRLDLKAYLDSLADLERRTYRRGIRPFHVRGLWAAGVGLLLLMFSNGAEDLLCEPSLVAGAVPDVLALLGIAALVLATVQFHVFFDREAEHEQLFQGLTGAAPRPGVRPPALAEENRA